MKKQTLFILFLSLSFFSFAQKQKPSQPKLVVGIVVDQMRYDYLYKYWEKYGDGGFRKLLNKGFNCKNTTLDYIPAVTAAGHAAIYTGAPPGVNGIISNDWYVRKAGRRGNCVLDTSETPAFFSPCNMLTTTITDELRLSDNLKSRVIGIALKERAAILPAGHLANGCYWLDQKTNKWVSGKYYMKEVPKWVNDFNAQQYVSKYLSKPWTTLLPIEQYTESIADDNEFEGLQPGETKPVFPHNLPAISKGDTAAALRLTPFANTLTKDFAKEAIVQEKLGMGGVCDFITISFSSTDLIGHLYAPQSVEVEDTYLRLDKDLENLINFLEKNIGKNNFLLFLTADHGAALNPSYMTSKNIPAGYVHSAVIKDSLQNFLVNVYGKGDWVADVYTDQVYLNHEQIETKRLNIYNIQRQVADYMTRLTGVQTAFTTYMLTNSSYESGAGHLAQRGYNPQRSGDVIIIQEPGWLENAKKTGTNHGGVYSYDQHVPLLWYGWNIKNGSSVEDVSVTDIAPTIAAMLNISFPNGCTGKPIPALFK